VTQIESLTSPYLRALWPPPVLSACNRYPGFCALSSSPSRTPLCENAKPAPRASRHIEYNTLHSGSISRSFTSLCTITRTFQSSTKQRLGVCRIEVSPLLPDERILELKSELWIYSIDILFITITLDTIVIFLILMTDISLFFRRRKLNAVPNNVAT